MDNVRSFKHLVTTQFLTVFNDNLFKQSVLLIAVGLASTFPAMQSWAQALFSAPFFFFAAFAGDLADRYSKRKIIILCKYIEAAIMLLAALSFFLQSNTALLITVALMGTQSAFLGPAKYGAIRDYRDGEKLTNANGIFQSSVLFGILLGTGCAGHLSDSLLWLLGVLMAVIAIGGAKMATKMDSVAVHSQAKTKRLRINPVLKLVSGLRYAKQYRGLCSAMIGHAVFWLCGSWILLAWNEFLIPLDDGSRIVEVSKGMWSIGLASLSIFMGLGAFICGRSIQKNIFKRVPLIGGAGMAVGLYCCAVFGHSPLSIWLSLAVASFFSGFYLIPLRSLVQFITPPHAIGSMLGLNQMLDFGFILATALLRPWLLIKGVGANDLLLITAVLMACSCLMLKVCLPTKTSLSQA